MKRFVPKLKARIIINGTSIIDDFDKIDLYIPEGFSVGSDDFKVEPVFISDYQLSKLKECTGF